MEPLPTQGRKDNAVSTREPARLPMRLRTNMQRNSGFFKLPTELRNIIYDLVSDGHQPGKATTTTVAVSAAPVVLSFLWRRPCLVFALKSSFDGL